MSSGFDILRVQKADSSAALRNGNAKKQLQKPVEFALYFPTHRKKRDGWGTRAFAAGAGKQIPRLRCGMEMQKETATAKADPPALRKDDN